MQTEDDKDTELTNKKIFELMDARFSRKYILYEHLHNSYNKLVDSIIKYYYTNDNIFEENRIGERVYRYKFKYENIHVSPPLNENGDSLMYPSDARDKSTMYTIKFVGKITQIQEIYDLNTKNIVSEKVVESPVERETILSIPCMVRSKYCSLQINQNYVKKECDYDPGGYFIVNGSEKYVLSLEKMVENKPLVFVKKEPGFLSYKVRVNSKSQNPNIMMQGIEINLEKKYNINIKVPIFNEVSVFVLMRALGLETDREIVKYIVYDENDIDMLNILKISIDLSKKEGKKLILNKEDAYYSLTNKVRVVKKYAEKDKKLQYEEKKEHLEALLRNAFIPHINSERYDDLLKVKAYFLGYMINKLLNCYLGRTEPDDRDSFVNKRIDMPGDLIFDLFKQYDKRMLNDCNKFFKKRNGSNHETPLNIINQRKSGNTEQAIKSAMMTGNWLKKKGVAQMYPRLTFLQSLSFLRRVDTSTDSSTMKLTGPRHYHPSQVGFLCLTGDTEILMDDGSIKLIKDIKNGDEVKTYDLNTEKIISTKIKNWFVQNTKELVKVLFDDGTIIKCTPEHEFLTCLNNGFEKNYEMIKIIDVKNRHILKLNKQNNLVLVRVSNIEYIEPEPVYDFETVLDTHNFFANSLCIKNCCVESPEHTNIGLVKHMALLSSICTGSDEQTEIIYNILKIDKNFIHINNHSPTQLINNVKVFLNGEWIGLSAKPYELYTMIRKLKQIGTIIRTNSIIYDIVKGEIKIYTDSGRLYRPLLTVKDNKILLTDKIINSVLGDNTLKRLNKWDALIEKYPETIDFVDMEEQYYMLVSEYKSNVEEMKKRESNVFEDSNKPIINRYDNSMILNYTHCEFHPTMVIGIIAGNIPFANHNQGPRNIFQYAQGRQALSIYTSNYRDRLDISYILYNVQKALVNTKIAKYVHTDILPCGEQAVVAIACYTGHNQDDSIIFNQSSIDRGLFRSISLKKYVSKVGKNQSTSQDDIFMKPDITKLTGTRHAVYDKLNDKGYVPEETYIENGDVIIGKVTPIQPAPGSNKCFKDSSEIYKSTESAIIDKVFTGIFDSEGNEMIKIRTRSERIPKIGDKFCCFESEHDILTINGWKKVNKITLNDKVACLVNGNTLEYKNPIAVQEYDYDGPMYKIKSNQIDLIVSPNHRMYVGNKNGTNYKIQKAEDIYGKRLTYKKNVEIYNSPNPMEEFVIPGIDELPDLIFNIEQWLTFFGIWIAEGCTLRNWGVSFATHKPRVKDALEHVCLQMNLKIHKHKDKLNDDIKNAWCISDKRLVTYFKPLSIGAVNKSLPDWVWNLNMNQCQTLIKGMLLGDGHTMSNGTCRYDTSSTQLADDFQKLCLHAGWSSNKIVKYEAGHESTTSYGEVIKSTKDAYRLTIITKQNNPLVNKNIKPDGTGRHDKWINFDDDELKDSIKNKIYCCSVPGDGVIYVRRNGYVSWCGQSRHGQKGTIGLTLSQSNMPFSEEGISPDLIINPQGIPSRMCVGHLLECLFGKAGAVKGMEVDGTSFNHMDIEKVKDILEEYGYQRNATEYLYNGMTGQKLHVPIYIGPTYYQRLKHLVMDKMHCLTGNHEILTLSGWIKITEIDTNIKVATLKNNNVIYDYPTEIHKYENSKEKKLYHIQNEYIDLTITDSHRVWVNSQLIPISQLDNTKIYEWENMNGKIKVNHLTSTRVFTSIESVYCISVPSEIFYVRKIGEDKPCWTGNSRARGPITMLTHQPPEGRTKDGGLRCGEMERDAIIAHGMSKFLKERFLNVSDAYSCYVCDICGLFAQRVIKKENKSIPQLSDTYECIGCKNKTKISKVIIPYAFKLLVQELMSMNIAPRIRTSQYNSSIKNNIVI
jgi:DNA-directed RNA polymerase beta subunit